MTFGEYTRALREEVLRQMMLQQVVYANVSVSPRELQMAYRLYHKRFKTPAQATFREIFIRAAETRKRDAARKTADFVKSLLDRGHDFAAVAKQYSEGPHAKDGGLWPPVRQGLRPEPVDALLFAAPVGKVAGPVETEYGFSILKVLERKEAGCVSFQDAQESLQTHVLAMKRRARYAAFMAQLEARHHVERMQ